MKIDYYLGLDAAKHKVRVALRGRAERLQAFMGNDGLCLASAIGGGCSWF
jgi:hypothetical protein